MKSSKQGSHRKRLSYDIGAHDFEARKKMNWPGLRPSPPSPLAGPILFNRFSRCKLDIFRSIKGSVTEQISANSGIVIN